MESFPHTTIFIIDDDNMLAMALKSNLEEMFKKQDILVSVFENGEDSLAYIGQKPDVAIVDYHLRSKGDVAMDGAGIIDMIKKKSPQTEVLIFTSEEYADIAVKAMGHDAHDYIVKNDYMFRKLNLSVMQCLKLKKLRSEVRLQKTKSKILTVSVALMAGALIVIELWAPQILGK